MICSWSLGLDLRQWPSIFLAAIRWGPWIFAKNKKNCMLLILIGEPLWTRNGVRRCDEDFLPTMKVVVAIFYVHFSKSMIHNSEPQAFVNTFLHCSALIWQLWGVPTPILQRELSSRCKIGVGTQFRRKLTPAFTTVPLITGTDGSLVSIAIIRICDSDCLCVSVRTIIPKRLLKSRSPNFAILPTNEY